MKNNRLLIFYITLVLIGIIMLFVKTLLIYNYIDSGYDIEKTQLLINNINTTFLILIITFIVNGSIGYFLEKYR